MDEKTLHGLLTEALADEPPLGPVAQQALHRGLRLRRRRRILTAAGTGAALAAVGLSVTIGLPAAGPAPAPALGPGPAEHTLYVMNAGTGDITPITADGKLGRPIQIGGRDLSPLAFSPDGKFFAVIAYEHDQLFTVNVADGTVGQPIDVGKYADSIAITPDGQTAYVARIDTNAVTPLDLAKGTAGTPITVPQPRGLAITPDGKTMYVLSGTSFAATGADAQGSVIPITIATGQAGKPIPVGDHPLRMAMSADGKVLLVSNSEKDSATDGSVTLIDTATNTAGKTLPTGQTSAAGAVFSPDGQTAYIVNPGAGTLVPIDLATQAMGKPISVGAPGKAGTEPLSVAITPDGKTAYVVTPSLKPTDSSTVTPIDTAAGTTGTPIQLPGEVDGIAVSPDGQTLYAASYRPIGLIPISISSNQAGQTIPFGKTGDVELYPGP